MTVGCSSAINVHSARSPTAPFDRYRTFAIDTTESALNGYASSAQSIEVRRRVIQQASKLLEARGYAHAVNGKPDLVLRVEAGRREREVQHPPHVRPGWLEEDEEEDFVEGAFVIDAIDAATEELVWHGSARAEVDPNRIDATRLQRAVASVMTSFPANARE
jgi:DNA-binding transcriptional MocR family regulator